MTDISKAIKWNLIGKLIITQPTWGSGVTVIPQIGPGQHSDVGPGSEAPGNLRNLAFSGYQTRAKNCSY